MTQISFGREFVSDWIQPMGNIFVKLLKLIAIPLILASLIKGISDLKDISQFRNIGLRTIVIYICTTIVAISIGLILVNIMQPGDGISQDTIDKLTATYASDSGVISKIEEASRQKEAGPLSFLEDMVPDNAMKAMSENKLMLTGYFLYHFYGYFNAFDWGKKSQDH